MPKTSGNKHFLEEYYNFVSIEWSSQYIFYDKLQAHYKQLNSIAKKGGLSSAPTVSSSVTDKNSRNNNALESFDQEFLEEIRRVRAFILLVVADVYNDLTELDIGLDREKLASTGLNFTTYEVALRAIFGKVNQLDPQNC